MFYICYRGKKLYGPLSEAEALREWSALTGMVKEVYIIETDEATGRIKRQIGPAARKKEIAPSGFTPEGAAFLLR